MESQTSLVRAKDTVKSTNIIISGSISCTGSPASHDNGGKKKNVPAELHTI